MLNDMVMKGEVKSTAKSIEETRQDESAENLPDEATRRRQACILELFGMIDFGPRVRLQSRTPAQRRAALTLFTP
jgi:hypothetical protein